MNLTLRQNFSQSCQLQIHVSRKEIAYEVSQYVKKPRIKDKPTIKGPKEEVNEASKPIYKPFALQQIPDQSEA